MRFVTAAAVLALTLSAGAAFAEEISADAQAGLDIAKQYSKTPKIKFRKVKVGADGNVCGLASVGSDRDIEFMVNPNDQTLWLNEGAQEPYSDFGYGDKILRSNGDRKQFQTWKACQSGK